MIAVSACLAGEPCRYDGRANRSEAVSRLVAAGNAVCICPECLGGLSTPREPAEIVGGSAEEVFSGHARVLTKSGADVTAAFGARGIRCIDSMPRTQHNGSGFKGKKPFLRMRRRV